MSSNDAFLDASVAISRRIVADAVWHEGRCSWVGAVMDSAQPWRAEYRALGADLYGGTAGVGLFLAQLAAVTTDADFHRTAVGALRHAVARSAAVPAARRDGFHAGSLGVAWAAARAAALLGEEELHAGARTVLTDASPPSGPDRCPDVAMGSAGSILALLALADTFDDRALIQDAVGVGKELIRRATVTRHGWSWAIPGRRYPHHLCGLSHGAAGIGWALLELFAATGDERFRAGATGAYAYERSWLDAGSGTWPDLRIGGQRRSRRRASHRRQSARGVTARAASRSRACARSPCSVQTLGCTTPRSRSRPPVDSSQGALPHEIEDLSLCHGAAGAADVLLCGADSLGEPWREAAGLAPQLGRVALERYGAPPIRGHAARPVPRRQGFSADSAGSPGGSCAYTTTRSLRR